MKKLILEWETKREIFLSIPGKKLYTRIHFSKLRIYVSNDLSVSSSCTDIQYCPKSLSALIWNLIWTGVDWKSLTIPACLPITTDYFPDKRSLQNDYVVSDYNLLPDDVNADFAQQRAIYKKPLTTTEVFKELVSQRLAQVKIRHHFYSHFHMSSERMTNPVSLRVFSWSFYRRSIRIKATGLATMPPPLLAR